MRINTNISALNAHRQLGINTDRGASAMEKLSSGLRINRAGDDAAGLAISEKMRGQIRGLTQASRNAQDGISLIQTAEGALNETHAILQRMRELATQSSTDTNTVVDRLEIQKEIDQLAEEITRIAETTEFNTQNLMGGPIGDRAKNFEAIFHIGANEAQNIKLVINDMGSDALKVAGEAGVRFEITSEDVDKVSDGWGALEADKEYTVMKFDKAVEGIALASNSKIDAQYAWLDEDGKAVAVSADGKDYYALTAATELGTEMTLAGESSNVKIEFADPVIKGTVTTAAGEGGDKLVATATATVAVLAEGIPTGKYTVVDKDSHPLISDENLGLADQAGNIIALSSDGKKWESLQGKDLFKTATELKAGNEITIGSEGGIDVSTQEVADKAITVINDAIETVSAERSKLGAMQNRLEHTIANLGTSAENLQAAESRIRDLDMAAEIMEFTKSNILNQAATAMLAQANMAPQTVLQLLG